MLDLARFLAAEPRARQRNAAGVDPDGRAVVLWMQRAQRVADNPALELAARVADGLGRPLAVFFQLVPGVPGAALRHYAFMLEGLVETAAALERLGAAFVLRVGRGGELVRLCAELRACLVVGDENLLRFAEAWREDVARRLRVAFVTVESDLVVPARLFPREEFAARTIRPKIVRLLPDFLTPPGTVRLGRRFPAALRPRSEVLDPAALLARVRPDRSAGTVPGAEPGPTAARRRLREFVARSLAHYAGRRNRPEFAEGTSRLSAYLHFGQIGPREVALAVRDSAAPRSAREAFLEEFIVRRELCANYVARNPNYDSCDGLNDWARATLRRHARDRRPYLYSERQLEGCATHDPLWNAAQKEMILTGHTHGYVRMYWAKKILEWSRSPEEALETAIRLNDKWLLDGRDPNGYAGIAWAVGGKHDRPWPERAVFGKVRCMTYASTSRKFDCAAYVERVRALG